MQLQRKMRRMSKMRRSQQIRMIKDLKCSELLEMAMQIKNKAQRE
jgi:hypothetical protein